MIVALDYKNQNHAGKIVASLPGVQLGPLHYRNLEINKNVALREHKGDFDAMMRISKQSYTELQWWVTNVHTAYKPIFTPPIDITIYSDVNLEGWGGTDSTTHVGGRWSEDECQICLLSDSAFKV